ncbi:Hypothetical protein, putative [Bodo saltans]|uniref:Uncharacterized protein n=1 Tax=Bodo saltans TaxID=75058 RepID=A0A0S4IS23_BODSA|nr:Hypothetical protein, putative [Bodo saltans]|eukprot:CUG04731.1 Hypothetical protein, putative [Bodo saltans]
MHFLSDDGSLSISADSCWEKLLSHSRQTKSSSAGGGGGAGVDTVWSCVPTLTKWLQRGEVVSEDDARNEVERCFSELSQRSLVAPLERMFQAAERVQQGATDASSSLRHQMLSSIFSSPETLATIALVDASAVVANGGRSLSHVGGVSFLPAHILHTMVDAYTAPGGSSTHYRQSGGGGHSAFADDDGDVRSPLASFQAASSPRRTLRTPPPSASSPRSGGASQHHMIEGRRSAPAPRPIPSDRVIGFEVTSLSQRVVNTLASLVSHWVLVGSIEECIASLRSLSRSVAALRAADAPVAAHSETTVSIVVVGGDGSDAIDEGNRSALRTLSLPISSAHPTIVSVASLGSSTASRAPPSPSLRRSQSSLHYALSSGNIGDGGQESLLAALRTAAWHTKPLCLDPPKRRELLDRASLPTPTPLTLQLVHSLLLFNGSTAASSSLASDVVIESAAVVTSEIHRYILCSGLELLSRNALLSGRYNTVHEVEVLVRKAAHSAFQDLCGPLCPRQSVVDALDDALGQVSKATFFDLETETYHIASHSAAAAVRGMANQLSDDDVLKLISPLDWTSNFESCLTNYLDKPLMPTSPSPAVASLRSSSGGAAGGVEENILMRSWSMGAKRSAMMDVLCKWYLPNAKHLFAADAERAQLRYRHVDGALRAAHQKQSDLESRLAAETERVKATTAQLGRVHAAADTLQEIQNTLQRTLVELQATTNAQLRLLKAQDVEDKFLEQNKTSKRLDRDEEFNNNRSGSASSDDSTSSSGSGDDGIKSRQQPTPTERLHKTIQTLLSGIGGCLRLLGAPTHGLLIDAARGITIQRPVLQAITSGPQSARSTPNVSMVYNMNSSIVGGVNKSNGVVRSPERRRGAGGATTGGAGFRGDIQAARQKTKDERHDVALNSSKQPTAFQAPPQQAYLGVVLPPSPISPSLVPLPAPTRGGGGAFADDGLDRQEERVHASMTAVMELQQRAVVLKEQLSAAQAQNRVLDGKLRDALMESSSLRDDLHDVEASYEAVKKELQLSNTHLTSERSSHETTSSTLQDRNQEVRHMQGLLDAEAIRVQHLDSEIASLRAQLADGSVTEERTRITLTETERRYEVLRVECNMHASTAQQLQHQIAQLEKTLLHERTEKRETIHRYEQRVQELLAKLDETVTRYEKILTSTATEAATRIDDLTRELSATQEAHRSVDQARLSTGTELESYRRELGELSARHDETTEERDDLRRRLAQLEDNYRALDIRCRVLAEENVNKDAKLASMREELHQSKQARAALIHSMDSLNMFIEEQRVLGGDDYRERPVSRGIRDENVEGTHSLLDMNYTSTTTTQQGYTNHLLPRQQAHLPEAMSIIRNVAAESIARDDTSPTSYGGGALGPSTTPVSYYVPLRELPHNLSTASGRAPISLSQLMHECPSDSDGAGGGATASSLRRASPPPTAFTPLYIPPAPHSRSSGARPLGPHLQALAAIDTLLDTKSR